MPRTPTILQSDFPYSVGGRCVNREWFDLPMDTVWQIMSEQLYFIHHAFGVKIHCFVLMSNHFHMILSTPNSNLSSAMQNFMQTTGRRLSKPSGRVNYNFGAPYFRSILCSNLYYLHTYKYNYANPVKAGIVERAEDYPYSTLNGLLGKSRLLIPVEEDLTLFSDVEGTLDWINRPPTEEHWLAVRKALRRREFKLSQVDRKAHPLESNTL